MTDKSTELIERYLYDVIRRLPEKQRTDIEQELKSLIEDMIEERMEAGEADRETCVKAALNQLGSPAKLARSYRGEHDSLISGEYYDNYCFVLKTVLICAGVGILVSNIMSAVIHAVTYVGETEGIIEIMTNDMINIGFIPTALIEIFGVVTLIYAIMERNHVKVTTDKTPWSWEKLPSIPLKKAVISRIDSVIGIIFIVLLAVIFTCIPQLMGAWMKQADGNLVAIPVFNLSIWNQVLPILLFSLAVSLVDEIVKLVAGRYSYAVMYVNIVTNVIGVVLAAILFKMFPIWNADFLPELEAVTGRTFQAKYDVMTYFNTDFFGNVLLAIILFASILEVGTTVYRTLRYEAGK